MVFPRYFKISNLCGLFVQTWFKPPTDKYASSLPSRSLTTLQSVSLTASTISWFCFFAFPLEEIEETGGKTWAWNLKNVEIALEIPFGVFSKYMEVEVYHWISVLTFCIPWPSSIQTSVWRIYDSWLTLCQTELWIWKTTWQSESGDSPTTAMVMSRDCHGYTRVLSVPDPRIFPPTD